MTRVTVYRNGRGECVGFRISGHAGYAAYGCDVVCAAISVLSINTVNAVEKFTSVSFSRKGDEKAGVISFKITGDPSKESDLLLETMILGLKSVAEDEEYADYIDLKFEEV